MKLILAWATATFVVLMWGAAAASSTAVASTGFGPLSGPNGCLVAPGAKSSEKGTATCGEGKGLVGANSVAVSSDGRNVYVASGTAGSDVATSFGSLAILKRDAVTGAISEVGCLSSDGTDGRDGASGACTPTPSLLGADGVAVSPDGSTVFVTASVSASVVAFARDPATGLLTRLGCFQFRPPVGSECAPANVFYTAGAIATSADGKALYIAAPTQGAISTLVAGSAAPAGVASLFGANALGGRLVNPCVAVNGFDGTCSVGIATKGLDALTPSSDGTQLYAAAPGSEAVDTFTRDASGTLTESGCLKVSPPPGLCTGSRLIQSPTQLAVSPDGSNVYVADSSDGHGRVDVLTRSPASGALSDSSCVDYLPEETHHGGAEEEEEGQEEAPSGPDQCASVAGLENVSVVAVSGDGSAVYAIGSGSAVVFSRERSTGKLTEASCASDEDKRCTSFPSLEGVQGAAVSPDGREVYVASAGSDAVTVFGVGATVASGQASATHAGTARVRLDCPSGLGRPCAGRLELTRTVTTKVRRGKRRRRVMRITVGGSGHFTIAPGHRAEISVELSRASRRLLAAGRRLRLTAVVRADPFAGGSGYGRHLTLLRQFSFRRASRKTGADPAYR
jgi:DNA-binding beta-propeller fold protein YncE